MILSCGVGADSSAVTVMVTMDSEGFAPVIRSSINRASEPPFESLQTFSSVELWRQPPPWPPFYYFPSLPVHIPGNLPLSPVNVKISPFPSKVLVNLHTIFCSSPLDRNHSKIPPNFAKFITFLFLGMAYLSNLITREIPPLSQWSAASRRVFSVICSYRPTLFSGQRQERVWFRWHQHSHYRFPIVRLELLQFLSIRASCLVFLHRAYWTRSMWIGTAVLGSTYRQWVRLFTNPSQFGAF